MSSEKTLELEEGASDRRNQVVRRNRLAREMEQTMTLSPPNVDPKNLTEAEKKLLRTFLETDGPMEVYMEYDPTIKEAPIMEPQRLSTSPKDFEIVTIPSDLLIHRDLVREVYGKDSIGTWENINPSPSNILSNTPEENEAEDEDTDNSEDGSFDAESFSEDMKGLAEDMEDQALRERRETFQAEIVDVGWEDKDRRKDRRIKLVLDIPTHGEEVKFLQTPKSDQWNTLPCFTDVLEHLNVNLRQADQIEGMSIPVSYDEKRPNNWEIALEKKKSKADEEKVVATRLYFLGRLPQLLGKSTESAWSWFVSSFSWARFAVFSIMTISVALTLGLLGPYSPNKLSTLVIAAFLLEMLGALLLLSWSEGK